MCPTLNANVVAAGKIHVPGMCTRRLLPNVQSYMESRRYARAGVAHTLAMF